MEQAGYQVWVADSSAKVFRDTRPRRLPRTGARIHAARNEHRALQIVVRANASALRNVRVSAAPLKGPGGRALHNVRLYRVAYLHLPKYHRDYPDPLPPYAPSDVAANQNQPVWLDVAVPEDAPAGLYRGEVAVQPEGMQAVTVPLTLRVYDFAVPTKPTMRTAFGLSEGYVFQQHGVQAGAAEAAALHQKYYWFLVDHRLSPYTIPADVMSGEAPRYLDDPRVTGFIVPYTHDETELKKRYDHVRSHGWMPKAYSYVVDEPVDEAPYARLQEVAERIHRLAPDMKLVAPYFRDPSFEGQGDVYDLLSGIVDIWCPNTGFFNAEKLAARRQLGEDIWWYVCCGPGEPYANFFVDMPGASHRALFWQQYLMRVQGLLYWSTTYWDSGSTPDPWQDIATVKWIGPHLYGDGSLLYPGKQVGIDGPVSSIRLELIREGAQDYEYLRLLEAKSGREAAVEAIGAAVQNLTHFTRSSTRLEAARSRIARAIAQ